MWMNTSEIEEAVRYLQNDQVLGPGARFLQTYQERIDSMSDGWAYWGYGTKRAEPLMNLIGPWGHPWGQKPATRPTQFEIWAACKKINTFIARCRQLKGKMEKIPLPYSTPDSWRRAPLKLRLTVDVDYNLNGEDPSLIETLLKNIPDLAAADGLLTSTTNADVEQWSAKVEARH